jgi:simple sugar transport system substrate-binding protein
MMVMNGEEITDGMDLGFPGYENVTLEDKVIYGQAFVDVDAENMDQYPF